MAHYYYFAATLPSLVFGAPPPLGRAEFLERAGRYLGAADLDLLSGLSLCAEEGLAPRCRIDEALASWDRALRNELVVLRARKLGKDASAWLKPALGTGAQGAARVAQAAMAAESPLAGEQLIEKERWNLLDHLAPFQSFDLDSLCAYLLKLLILERLTSFDLGRGEAAYRELYAAILGSARTSPITGVLR